MLPVTFEERGKDIQRRRMAHGFTSLRKFAEATRVTREAVKNAERGTASEGTYLRLESWLDDFDHSTGEDEPEPVIQQLEFFIEGEDVKVTVKGPVSDREALKADVADIIRSVRQASREKPQT